MAIHGKPTESLLSTRASTASTSIILQLLLLISRRLLLRQHHLIFIVGVELSEVQMALYIRLGVGTLVDRGRNLQQSH